MHPAPRLGRGPRHRPPGKRRRCPDRRRRRSRQEDRRGRRRLRAAGHGPRQCRAGGGRSHRGAEDEAPRRRRGNPRAAAAPVAHLVPGGSATRGEGRPRTGRPPRRQCRAGRPRGREPAALSPQARPIRPHRFPVQRPGPAPQRPLWVRPAGLRRPGAVSARQGDGRLPRCPGDPHHRSRSARRTRGLRVPARRRTRGRARPSRPAPRSGGKGLQRQRPDRRPLVGHRRLQRAVRGVDRIPARSADRLAHRAPRCGSLCDNRVRAEGRQERRRADDPHRPGRRESSGAAERRRPPATAAQRLDGRALAGGQGRRGTGAQAGQAGHRRLQRRRLHRDPAGRREDRVRLRSRRALRHRQGPALHRQRDHRDRPSHAHHSRADLDPQPLSDRRLQGRKDPGRVLGRPGRPARPSGRHRQPHGRARNDLVSQGRGQRRGGADRCRLQAAHWRRPVGRRRRGEGRRLPVHRH